MIVLRFFNNYTTFFLTNLCLPPTLKNITVQRQNLLIKPKCTGQDAFPAEIQSGTKGARNFPLGIPPHIHVRFTWQVGKESGPLFTCVLVKGE